MRPIRFIPLALACAALLATPGVAQIGANGKPIIIRQPKNPERDLLPNQERELPPQPASYVVADSARLAAFTAPLTANGLLTPQTRDAVRWVLSQSRGATIVHLRAFVVGTGDVRRIAQIVGEICTERRIAPPALTVVQAGALPLENAQVLLQAIVQQPRASKDAALRFVTAEAETADAAAATLRQHGTPLRATCYVPSVERLAPIDGVDYVQPQRAPRQTPVHCEALVRVAGNAETLVFTGAQLAFGESDEQATLSATRLQHALNAAHASLADALAVRVYPLSLTAARAASKALSANGATAPHADTIFEALPSLDGAWAVDAIARIASPQNANSSPR